MPFVNASTCNTKDDIYYGLLNNFPHQSNSTTAQKLAVGNFSSATASAAFSDLVFISSPTPPVIHFISFSPREAQLYGLAQYDNQTVAFVKIRHMENSTVSPYEVLGVAFPYTPGPLHSCALNCHKFALYASLRRADSGLRVFGGFDLHVGEFVPLQQYEDGDVVAGVAFLEW